MRNRAASSSGWMLLTRLCVAGVGMMLGILRILPSCHDRTIVGVNVSAGWNRPDLCLRGRVDSIGRSRRRLITLCRSRWEVSLLVDHRIRDVLFDLRLEPRLRLAVRVHLACLSIWLDISIRICLPATDVRRQGWRFLIGSLRLLRKGSCLIVGWLRLHSVWEAARRLLPVIKLRRLLWRSISERLLLLALIRVVGASGIRRFSLRDVASWL